MSENLQEIIDNLNYHIWDKCPDPENYLGFSYESTTMCEAIKFCDLVLWDSENKPHKVDYDTGEEEPIEDCVKRLFDEYVHELNKIKFNKKLNIFVRHGKKDTEFYLNGLQVATSNYSEGLKAFVLWFKLEISEERYELPTMEAVEEKVNEICLEWLEECYE
jgi:hypothetical protein